MTFVQRALNTAISTASLLMRWFYVHPKIYSLVSQVFPGEDLAGIDELLNTASMLNIMHNRSNFSTQVCSLITGLHLLATD